MPDGAPRDPELAEFKKRVDTAREALDAFIQETQQARGLEQRFKLEVLRLRYEMNLSDFQKAVHEAAERRADRGTEEHRREMMALEKSAIDRAAKSDAIQEAMTRANRSMTKATWIFGLIGAWLVAIQAYKTVYPSPVPPWLETAPISSFTKN
jgi:hypothetical protein